MKKGSLKATTMDIPFYQRVAGGLYARSAPKQGQDAIAQRLHP
jgi:hypothetical protein